MIDALTDAGHGVTLYTVDKTDWTQIEANWGIRNKPAQLWRLKNRGWLSPPLVKMPIIFALYIGLLKRAAKKRHHISLNNYGEALPLFTDAAYIHSLPLTESPENPYNIPLWIMLKPLYKALLSIFASYYPSLIITNSHYNASNIRTPTRRYTTILYPPVDNIEAATTEKTPTILTTSRPSKAKKLETIPTIAAQVKTPCHFHICLTTNQTPIKQRQNSNITTHINPSKKQLEHLRSTSTIYLSTQPTDAYGLSILEAMSAGCIPLVPRDGGPWHDILARKQGETGYTYNTPREAARHIDKILTDKPLAEKLRNASIQRAKHFQDTGFSKKLPDLLEKLTETKAKTCNR
jgi:glycosyltransferase involved in cell wall biosynthesis